MPAPAFDQGIPGPNTPAPAPAELDPSVLAQMRSHPTMIRSYENWRKQYLDYYRPGSPRDARVDSFDLFLKQLAGTDPGIATRLGIGAPGGAAGPAGGVATGQAPMVQSRGNAPVSKMPVRNPPPMIGQAPQLPPHYGPAPGFIPPQVGKAPGLTPHYGPPPTGDPGNLGGPMAGGGIMQPPAAGQPGEPMGGPMAQPKQQVGTIGTAAMSGVMA
jgi:hypothetical protein